MKVITEISDQRAQKIKKKREEKWCPLTFEDLKLMFDTPNNMWDLLIQAEKDYIAEKEKESMSSEHERVKKLERYGAELRAEFGILQKQNALMQSEFEQN